MKAENNLETDQIRQLVWRLAIPSMLAQFVSVFYSIVDRIYIGNIPEIGELALAGVGVCGPVVTMVTSVASWVGVGGAPLFKYPPGAEKSGRSQEDPGQLFSSPDCAFGSHYRGDDPGQGYAVNLVWSQ